MMRFRIEQYSKALAVIDAEDPTYQPGDELTYKQHYVLALWISNKPENNEKWDQLEGNHIFIFETWQIQKARRLCALLNEGHHK